jgi:hypothetical protein
MRCSRFAKRWLYGFALVVSALLALNECQARQSNSNMVMTARIFSTGPQSGVTLTLTNATVSLGNQRGISSGPGTTSNSTWSFSFDSATVSGSTLFMITHDHDWLIGRAPKLFGLRQITETQFTMSGSGITLVAGTGHPKPIKKTYTSIVFGSHTITVRVPAILILAILGAALLLSGWAVVDGIMRLVNRRKDNEARLTPESASSP